MHGGVYGLQLHHTQQELHQTQQENGLHKFRPPRPARTHPLAWVAAVICTALLVVIILGGIAVLVVYLFFRPRSPRMDVSGATLNSGYLDSDPATNTANLLNADLTVLLNFSNPNVKVSVSFSYMAVDLYFKGTLLATQGVQTFPEGLGESQLRSVNLVASEVALSSADAAAWKGQVTSGAVGLQVMGRLRTRSDLGSFLRYSYWLYSRCSVVVGAPPSGALLSRTCQTKR